MLVFLSKLLKVTIATYVSHLHIRGAKELAHVEIISAILYQLTDGLTIDDIKNSGFDKYFVDHTIGIYPQAASGMPFSASTLQSTGDPIADLSEDMAADGAIA